MTVHKIKGNHYTNTAMNFNGTISEGLNGEEGGLKITNHLNFGQLTIKYLPD